MQLMRICLMNDMKYIHKITVDSSEHATISIFGSLVPSRPLDDDYRGSRAVALPPSRHCSAGLRPSYLPRQPVPKPLPRSVISSKIPFAPKEPVQHVERSFFARGLVLWRVKVIFDGQLGLSPEAFIHGTKRGKGEGRGSAI